MRVPAVLLTLIFGGVTAAAAQSGVPRGDAAFTYQGVRTNTQPGACGCFGLNGGGVSASWGFTSRLRAVAEVSGGHQGRGPVTGNSLTLVSYLAGARYSLPLPRKIAMDRLQPFAQLLLGAAHAGGGIAGVADGTYAFATRVGGGLDLPLSEHISVRAAQVDYYLTGFANTVNGHQNNLLVAGGLVVHWP